MVLDASGKVGIAGASSPNALLHVGGTADTQGSQANPAIQIGSTTGYRLGMYTDAEGGYIENKNGDDGLRFKVKTAGEAMRIDGGTADVILSSQIYGGFGANGTGGTADWNHATNARSGMGYTLLLGTDTNGMGGNIYYHVMNYEYSSKNGTGNMTQLAIPYYGSTTIYARVRYQGGWSSWGTV